jgi:antimicrobial peptide system SdpA family protein
VVADPAVVTRLGRLALVLFLVGVAIFSYAVHAPMPANAVSLPGERSMKLSIQQLLPQGWAFFTRNPREPDLLLFTLDRDGQWRDAMRPPHAEPRNAFGFARASRTQGVEAGVLISRLTDQRWQECRILPVDCLRRAPTVTVANPTPKPTVCGDIGLVSQPPVPWAWSRSGRTVTMPSTVIRLVVSC